jgi:phage-related protein (TIGR01555 family)
VRFSGQPLRVPNSGLETFDRTGAHAQPELAVSVLTPVLNMLSQYGLAWSSVSNMLQDASIGWMRIAGLVEALASEDKAIIEDRMRVMQQTKGVHRMYWLDADNNEEYGRTEVSLTDVPAIMQQFMVAVAGAADVPAAIFFSSSPAGLNANAKGEGDQTQLYNTCADYQRRYIGPKLDTIHTAVAGGTETHVEWPSLWEASDNEKAQTRLSRANATKAYWDMGAIEASDIVKAEQTGTNPELIGTPDDDRLALDPQPPPAPGAGPQGAPGKQGAAKIATTQRAKQK